MMKIIKRKKLLTIISILFLSTSCSKVPDGEIKNFVENFSFERAYKNINNGIIEVSNSNYVNDELKGTYKAYYEFYKDKYDEKFYFYKKENYTGTYINEDNNLTNYETLQYTKEDKSIYSVEIRNEVKKELKYSKTNLYDSICSIFYSEKDYDYYRGSYYYGDLIKININSYYILFTIDNDLLTYEVKNDGSYEGVIFNNNYTLNKYGMLTTYHFDGIYEENNEKIINDITCSYNIDFDKKREI